MGTKNNPGAFDCYNKLEPDEPYFLLKSTDPLAPVVVELWASLAELHSGGGLKVEEARACAASMREWRDAQLGKGTNDTERLARGDPGRFRDVARANDFIGQLRRALDDQIARRVAAEKRAKEVERARDETVAAWASAADDRDTYSSKLAAAEDRARS